VLSHAQGIHQIIETEYQAFRLQGTLLADDLDQHPLLAAAVELTVEDLLPGTEVELSGSHRDHHFTAHHLALDMGVSVVFSSSVVMVLVDRFVRRQVLEPDLVVMMQSALIIVDED